MIIQSFNKVNNYSYTLKNAYLELQVHLTTYFTNDTFPTRQKLYHLIHINAANVLTVLLHTRNRIISCHIQREKMLPSITKKYIVTSLMTKFF